MKITINITREELYRLACVIDTAKSAGEYANTYDTDLANVDKWETSESKKDVDAANKLYNKIRVEMDKNK